MEEEFGFNNILGEAEIEDLFSEMPPSTETEEDETEKESNEREKTTEVDPEDLFDGGGKEKPESVGSEKDKKSKEQEDSSADGGGGTSPNFYSSIADAMAEDGIFPNLDEETVKGATDPESFSDLIEQEVLARLDEKQQRISKALENGVEPSSIRYYEGVLNQLNRLTEKQITEEGEAGERLRYQLITQDLINKGMSAEKADKLAKRSIDAGVDLDDAKEALQSNKEHFQKEYKKLLEEAEKSAEAERADRKKKQEELKESLLKDKNLMGDLELGSDIRKKAFESITKPVYKDPETGEYMTSIQKYEHEHRSDFLKYVSLFYAMTNGFSDFKGMVKGTVKKEIKRGLSELEKTLNSTKRNTDGSLRMVTSVRDDPESFYSKGLRLDL